MQKYALIYFLEKLPEGTEFSAAEWPLHVTLVSNFVLDVEKAELLKKLSLLLAAQQPIKTTAGDDEHFGAQGQVRVTVLDINAQLMDLHNKMMSLLKGSGAVFDEPQYLGEGYRAHTTVRPTLRLHKGDHVRIDSVTLLDMFPNNDIHRRKLLQTIRFAE